MTACSKGGHPTPVRAFVEAGTAGACACSVRLTRIRDNAGRLEIIPSVGEAAALASLVGLVA